MTDREPTNVSSPMAMLVFVLICFMLGLAFSSLSLLFNEPEPQPLPQCEAYVKAANDKVRRIISLNDSVFFVSKPGEAYHSIQVKEEEVGPCGTITQWVDLDDDGTADLKLIWRPAYISESDRYDHRTVSDVYSVGAKITYMLAGMYPIKEE